jgi:hypothetical protein
MDTDKDRIEEEFLVWNFLLLVFLRLLLLTSAQSFGLFQLSSLFSRAAPRQFKSKQRHEKQQ